MSCSTFNILRPATLPWCLRAYTWGQPQGQPYDWAARFETTVRDLVVHGGFRSLVDYTSLGPDASLAVPTPEHYLPLLYALGASEASEPVSFPTAGIEGGSVSMLSIQLG